MSFPIDSYTICLYRIIIQKSVCSALASLPYNINFEVSPAKEEMNNKNAKIFKFPRK